jgi:hypothetical protein
MVGDRHFNDDRIGLSENCFTNDRVRMSEGVKWLSFPDKRESVCLE